MGDGNDGLPSPKHFCCVWVGGPRGALPAFLASAEIYSAIVPTLERGAARHMGKTTHVRWGHDG